jgi:hypothetical protein
MSDWPRNIVREQKDASRTKTETLTRHLLFDRAAGTPHDPLFGCDPEASSHREITKSYRQLLAGRAMPDV